MNKESYSRKNHIFNGLFAIAGKRGLIGTEEGSSYPDESESTF